MIEWCFTPLSTVFQLYHGDSSHYSCLSLVLPVLGWALMCLAQGHSHVKNPEDQVRLEPKTLGLRVKYFTTEPRGTKESANIPKILKTMSWSLRLIELYFSPIWTVFQSYHGNSPHYSCLSWVSQVIGWGRVSKLSCTRTLPRETQRIQCGSNPVLIEYETNTLPLSNAEPPWSSRTISPFSKTSAVLIPGFWIYFSFTSLRW